MGKDGAEQAEIHLPIQQQNVYILLILVYHNFRKMEENIICVCLQNCQLRQNKHNRWAKQKCLWAYADSEGPDQPTHLCSYIRLCCLLTESLDTIECINGEQMPSHSRYKSESVHLGMFEDTFLLGANQIC